MGNTINAKLIIKNELDKALDILNFKNTEVSLEKTSFAKFGDYATNAPLVLSKILNKPKEEIAESIISKLNNPLFKASYSSNGFINFSLTDAFLLDISKEIVELGGAFGSADIGKGTKVSVEFVSANPTGPMHIGNARGGPLGDTIATVLAKVGYSVVREYYHNNIGGQIIKLGETVKYYIEQDLGKNPAFPEGGYAGLYIKDYVSNNLNLLKATWENSGSLEELGMVLANTFKDSVLTDCKNMGIVFDKITQESEIVKKEDSKNSILEKFKKENALKASEGAIWFAPSDEFLKDRECVLVKKDGKNTYFLNDIVYHIEKSKKGAKLAIDILGSNHAGHAPRMYGAMQALGLKNFLSIVFYQWVTLIKDGKEVSMSKRKGDFVLASEVLTEVGKDYFRWFFLNKESNTPIKFDLSLAKEKSSRNQVYFVQYACARINSVLNKSRKEGGFEYGVLEQGERDLLQKLIYFPDVVEEVARNYKTNKLCEYALEVAGSFHKFYETCPILENPNESQRINTLKATKVVLEETLRLIGIEAPQKM